MKPFLRRMTTPLSLQSSHQPAMRTGNGKTTVALAVAMSKITQGYKVLHCAPQNALAAEFYDATEALDLAPGLLVGQKVFLRGGVRGARDEPRHSTKLFVASIDSVGSLRVQVDEVVLDDGDPTRNDQVISLLAGQKSVRRMIVFGHLRQLAPVNVTSPLRCAIPDSSARS